MRLKKEIEMNTTKKLLFIMMAIATMARISAVANGSTTTQTPYTTEQVNGWISQIDTLTKYFQDTKTPTDQNMIDATKTIDTTISNLGGTFDSFVQQSQKDLLTTKIATLQTLLTPYAYTFTNNAPFSVTIESKNTNPASTIAIPIAASQTKIEYRLTPFTNVSVRSKINSINKYYKNTQTNASFDIVLRELGNNIQLNKTSDSGRNYTNKTGYHVSMVSKPKGHNSKKSFELDQGQSTGQASNDKMQEIWINVTMPKTSDAQANFALGRYSINYDKAANQLTLTPAPTPVAAPAPAATPDAASAAPAA